MPPYSLHGSGSEHPPSNPTGAGPVGGADPVGGSDPGGGGGTGNGTDPNPTGSTIQTIADLIAKGADGGGGGGAAGTPQLVPVSGGSGLPLLSLLLIGGIGFAIYWFFIRKKKEGA